MAKKILLFLIIALSLIISTGLVFAWTGPSSSPPTGSGLFYYLNGNIGVGTQSPVQKLDVNGTVQMSGFKLPNGASNGYILTSDANGVGSWLTATSSGGQWTTSGNNIYNSNSGNVGIITASPGATLDVSGNNIYAGADHGTDLKTRTDNVAKSGRLASFHYDNDASPVTLILGYNNSTANQVMLGGGTNTQNAATQISLFTASNTTTALGTERMRIDGSGNVGIGTTNPIVKLDVSGGAGTGGMRVNGSISSGLTAPNSAFVDTNTSGTARWISFGPDTNTVGAHQFITARSDGSVWTAPMIIDNSGNVGIGTANPSQKLEVNGNAKATAFFSGVTSTTAPYSANTDVQIASCSNQSCSYLVSVECDTSGTGGITALYAVSIRYWYTTVSAMKLTKIVEATEGDPVFTATGGNPPVLYVKLPNTYGSGCTFTLTKVSS